MSTFNDFKQMAKNPSLSHREKVGFLDKHRKNSEHKIFADIRDKLGIPSFSKEKIKIMDIGCGCSTPVFELIDFCLKQDNIELYLVDCQEMLDLLPDHARIIKIPAEFPKDSVFQSLQGKMDFVICYSVLHIIQDPLLFVKNISDLLSCGGRSLIGDIANIQKKQRFLESEVGKTFHRQWSNSDEIPTITQDEIERGINDTLLFEILKQSRNLGFESYLLEQTIGLPLCHSREDILIVKR